MKKIIFGALAVSAVAAAHVRQRSFYQYDDSNIKRGGLETIIRWTSQLPIKMHEFSGCLGSSSVISFDGSEGGCAGDAHSIVGSAIGEWFGTTLLGVAPSLELVLDNDDKPVAGVSACETKTNGDADGVNNIVFTSKINPACASSIEDYDGVIGLTRVRYSISSGKIVEGDIQFNDAIYTFVDTGSNDLSADEINLKDVATHEVGHLFGLDHSASRTSTMLFAVSDGMNSASSDDLAGLWSLYPTESAGLGSLKGSLTASGSPVFGAAVYALDLRTLQVVASEMTNLDGAFEFCGLPEGNYVAFANSYRPASSNIHEYYSGFDGYAPKSGALCANPGCIRMTTTMQHSWYTSGDADFGKNMTVFSVAGGTTNKYLNIEATTTAFDMTAIGTTVSDLDLDTPRLMKFRDAVLGSTASGALAGRNDFRVHTTSDTLNVSIAALGIYGRLNLTLALLDNAGAALAGAESCTLTAGVVAQGKDPKLVCTGLTAATNYRVRVTASAVPCSSVPGNDSSCDSLAKEIASTPSPYYLINAYDPSLGVESVTGADLSSSTNASSDFKSSPSCSSYSGEIKEEKAPGCCGSLGGGGIDPGKSLWLGLLMSPLTWLMVAIAVARLRRKLHLER